MSNTCHSESSYLNSSERFMYKIIYEALIVRREAVDTRGDSPNIDNCQIQVNDLVISERNDQEECELLLEPSLPESFRSVSVPNADANWRKKMYSYAGPGALVAVGYMDPGNWSTDIAGGSAYHYHLLFIILLSSIIAMFLQSLTVKLGVVSGRDLAQCCKDSYTRPISNFLWVVMEIAIAATDLAEVIGSAIALKLLFGLPIVAGVCVTVADVLLLLLFKGKHIRMVELLVILLVSVIAVCFCVELSYSKPIFVDLITGFIPTSQLVTDSQMLFLAISIIGATVMPHNLFLHSSLVLTRASRVDHAGKNEAIKYSTIDSTVALLGAFFVNASILIVASSAFYVHGYHDVATLEEAYKLLDPILGGKAASILFGVALLASGQSSTFTGTLSGQIVMEGFLNLKISPIYRRLITRSIAIIPALIVTAIAGDKSVNDLLLISQVTLCFALPFAIYPLVSFTSDVDRMGTYVNTWYTKIISYLIFLVISGLNLFLIYNTIVTTSA